MHSQRFEFPGAQGQRLFGQLDLPDGTPQAYAVLAHCFTCTQRSLAAVRVSRALVDRGIGVLRFDFTGIGESEGDATASGFSGNIADLLAAIRHLGAQDRRPTLLVGHSLGGAAVLAAAGEAPEIQCVAVINAPAEASHILELFGDAEEQAKGGARVAVDLGGKPFFVDRHFIEDLQAQDQAERIARLRRPLLILHSPQDRIVPIDHASRIFQAARHPKSFVSLDEADHLLSRREDAEYAAEVIAAWGSRYLATAAVADATDAGNAVVVEETGAGRYQVEVKVGTTRFFADEPMAVGGLGSGPSPYELLSAALGACSAMTARLYAERKGWPLTRVRVTVGHQKHAEQHPADCFVRDLRFEGELTADQRARLLDIVGRCPVHRTLEAGARVETQQEAAAPTELSAEDPREHAWEMQRLAPQDITSKDPDAREH